MSEDRTAETNGGTFEERVFARFDSIDSRFDGVDSRFDGVETRLDSVQTRLEKLESKQYDTKPFWERALSEIAELRTEMQKSTQETRTEMQTGFQEIRIELDDGLRRTADQIDALNRSVLEIRGELRYFRRRLDKVESEFVKPS